jgi:hypothetical protein
MSYNLVIGYGTNSGEALLYCRINQIGYDKDIKSGTISRKTRCVEIDMTKFTNYDSSKMVMAIHFASRYYIYQQNPPTIPFNEFC